MLFIIKNLSKEKDLSKLLIFIIKNLSKEKDLSKLLIKRSDKASLLQFLNFWQFCLSRDSTTKTTFILRNPWNN